MDASVKVTALRGDAETAFEQRLSRYTIVADANQAYRGGPVGFPLFVTHGSGRTTVSPLGEFVVYVMAAPGAQPTELFAGVKKVFEDHGVRIMSQGEEPDDRRWYEPEGPGTQIRLVGFPNQKPETASLVLRFLLATAGTSAFEGAVQAVRERYGSAIGKIAERVDLPPAQRVLDVGSAADGAARAVAETLARVSGSAGLQGFPLVASFEASYESALLQPFLSNSRVFADNVPQIDGVTAYASADFAFAGLRPTEPRTLAPIETAARKLATAGRPFPQPSPIVEVAGDLPELYAVGTSDAFSATDAGLDAQAVALIGARERTRDVARMLGVRTGRETLVFIGGGVGLASTFDGAALPRVTAASPVAGAVIEQRQDLEVALPFSVPDPASTIAESALASVRPSASAFRLSLDVNGVPTPAYGEVVAAAARIRSLPGVADVATTQDEADVRFEVLLNAASRAAIPRVAAIIAGLGRSQGASLSYELTPYFADCRGLETRLLAQAFAADAAAAGKGAAASGRRLRKLVVVAASPPDNTTPCPPLARRPGLLLQEIPRRSADRRWPRRRGCGDADV